MWASHRRGSSPGAAGSGTLQLTAELVGETVAKSIQLGIEYDPQPPFDHGNVDQADPEIRERLYAVLRR